MNAILKATSPPAGIDDVIDDIIPKSVSTLGKRLVPLKAGHQLLISQIRHPLATGEKWEDSDVLMALFIFSRPSRELFAALADDTFEAEFFAFIDCIPSADVPVLGQDMVSHWVRSRASAATDQKAHAAAKPGGLLRRVFSRFTPKI